MLLNNFGRKSKIKIRNWLNLIKIIKKLKLRMLKLKLIKTELKLKSNRTSK